jgi:hypothetical protein
LAAALKVLRGAAWQLVEGGTTDEKATALAFLGRLELLGDSIPEELQELLAEVVGGFAPAAPRLPESCPPVLGVAIG